jgi:hypothetical protein
MITIQTFQTWPKECPKSFHARFKRNIAIIHEIERLCTKDSAVPHLLMACEPDQRDKCAFPLYSLCVSVIPLSLQQFIQQWYTQYGVSFSTARAWILPFLKTIAATMSTLHSMGVIHHGLNLDAFGVDVVSAVSPSHYRLILHNFDRCEWTTSTETSERSDDADIDELAYQYGLMYRNLDGQRGEMVPLDISQAAFLPPEALRRWYQIVKWEKRWTLRQIKRRLRQQDVNESTRKLLAFGLSRRIESQAAQLRWPPKYYSRCDVYSFAMLGFVMMNPLLWKRQAFMHRWEPNELVFAPDFGTKVL